MASHDSPTDSSAPPSRSAGGAVIGQLILIFGITLVFWNSGLRMPQVLPRNIGTNTGVDDLFWIIFGVTGFFFLLTEGMLIYFCVRYRAKPGGKAVHTHGSHALELAWTLIPGCILFVLAVMQTGVWSENKYMTAMPNEKEAVVVQVLGKQFQWFFRYAGSDGEFGTADDITSADKLHVPVDRDVIVRLQTLDVLHSFWLPNLRLKQDLVPGQTIPQWFKAVETGKYEIVCAELCGSGHTTMRGELHVHSAEDFAAWKAKQFEGSGEHIPDKDPNWKYWYAPRQEASPRKSPTQPTAKTTTRTSITSRVVSGRSGFSATTTRSSANSSCSRRCCGRCSAARWPSWCASRSPGPTRPTRSSATGSSRPTRARCRSSGTTWRSPCTPRS